MHQGSELHLKGGNNCFTFNPSYVHFFSFTKFLCFQCTSNSRDMYMTAAPAV